MKLKKLKNEKGIFSSGIFGILFLFLLFIIFDFIVSRYAIVSESETVHDSLVASNLAALSSKNLDLDLIAQYPNVVEIKDPNMVLQTFESHIKNNLNLDDSYKPKNKNFIKSKVNIREFIIYNVNTETNDVVVYTLNTDTMMFSKEDYPNGKGNLKTSKGNVVNKTTIHSTIDFDIDVIFGQIKNVQISEDNGTLKK